MEETVGRERDGGASNRVDGGPKETKHQEEEK
jgi:hypothetical protein